MLTILLLLLSVATGAVAEQICTMQKGVVVAATYADIVPVVEHNTFAEARLIQQGRLPQLPKGTRVELLGAPLANGAVQIRLPGTSQEFWTAMRFLDCPR
jgi:hypothetical protein